MVAKDMTDFQARRLQRRLEDLEVSLTTAGLSLTSAHESNRYTSLIIPPTATTTRLARSSSVRRQPGRSEEETDAKCEASAVYQEKSTRLAGRAPERAYAAVRPRCCACASRSPQTTLCVVWVYWEIPVSEVCRVELLYRLRGYA